MIRNIKTLGLAIVAVAAMSMAAASAVQASELHATHNGNVTITGQQIAQHIFKITTSTQTPASTTCTTATFEGTVPFVSGTQVTSNDLTTTATYSGCQSLGLAASVKMNGCKYTITGKANTNTGATAALTGYVDINCEAGKVIEVNAGFGACIITVGQQHDLSHIIFSNTTEAGKPHHTHANITITGIKYETHGGFCGHTGTVPRTDATYTGQATFRAYKDKGTEQVTEHGVQFTKSKHSNEQVGLLAT